ncbi:MAG: hypothetical protein JO097_09250 [Acidobacteriaceae bacterium]|nr:hypothetical protein [Acidobacteriaceae bacterium]MBV9295953.1 hypothetical protein [Acidobacteriaceae bacterium]MBV9765194.1 hypothetical protein [Acidobacteriaceae bacterium]
MSIQGLVSIKKALSTLNPKQVREMRERSVHIALHADSQEGYRRMEDFFLRDLSPARRRESAVLLTRAPIPVLAQRYDIDVYGEGVVAPHDSLVFHPDSPHRLVQKSLAKHPDLGVPLARAFLPFRRPFVDRVIAKTCKENTLFSITTALPDIIPSVIELPWAVAEFASDTAFLTMNQVRMAFLIAAASDRDVGYSEQKSEIATIIGSAFGWRALAKQIVGKIPFGGGVIGKAAVAYAGTKVLGLSLEHLYSIGFTYTREERDRLYADAFRQGKKVATRILGYFRPDLAARYAAEAAKQTLPASAAR